MKLTDTFVKRKQGNGKVQKHSDGGGLYLHVTPQGSKSWRMGYRFMGKQKLLVIGPYPAVSLKEARERRDAAKKLLVDNIDPSTPSRKPRPLRSFPPRTLFRRSPWNGWKSIPFVGRRHTRITFCGAWKSMCSRPLANVQSKALPPQSCWRLYAGPKIKELASWRIWP